jgi:serine/threonine protein kinase
MGLTAGSRVGPYEILAALGAGGMGEVYRARHIRLDREVAIKVLPETVARNRKALARFEHEAKAVAALAHPNILAIYDFGTQGGIAYAAMELLEGETLRERLGPGPLPPRKAAELGRQVAHALGAAHEKGIVHRDLKPENVFVTRRGRAKVLDFGLAGSTAAVGTEISDPVTQSPTRTGLTLPGAVLGTAAYMSPEQVRGEAVDHRADVFSFGSVLHEMLTGRPAFQRETSAETMTAILREDPAGSASGDAAVPAALERVVRRCLEKRPEERFQSARDLAFAIENAAGATSDAPAPPVGVVPLRRRRSKTLAWVGVPALVVIGFLAGFTADRVATPPPGERPIKIRTLTFSGRDGEPSASPDGRMIAFTSYRDGIPRVWIKQLVGSGEERLTEGPDTLPRFSPDGSTILFLRAEGDLLSAYRQSLVGGQARKLIENVVEAEWSPDGSRIGFIRSRGGLRYGTVGVADAQDGSEREIAELEHALYGLRWAPDGRSILVISTTITGTSAGYDLMRIDVDRGDMERIDLGDEPGPISPVVWSGYGNELLFARSGSLVGDEGDRLGRLVRRNLDTGLEATLFWTENIFPLLGVSTDCARFDIVRPGVLVFDRVAVRQELKEFTLERAGAVERRRLTQGQGRDRQPVYSPDGTRLLFTSNRSGNLDLWLLDLESGALRQLTDDAAQDWDPAFTRPVRSPGTASMQRIRFPPPTGSGSSTGAPIPRSSASGRSVKTVPSRRDSSRVPTSSRRSRRTAAPWPTSASRPTTCAVSSVSST